MENNIESTVRQFAPKNAFKARAQYIGPKDGYTGGVRISYHGYNGRFLKALILPKWPKIPQFDIVLHDDTVSAFLVRSKHRSEIILTDTAAEARAAFKKAHPNTLIDNVERVSGEAKA